MDLGNAESMNVDTLSDEETVLLVNEDMENDADDQNFYELLPEFEQSVELILEATDLKNTQDEEKKLSYGAVVQDFTGSLEVDYMPFVNDQYGEETICDALKRLEKLENIQINFNESKLQNLVNIWNQFSQVQENFDKLLDKTKMKTNILELAVANSYKLYEKENYDLTQRLELLERVFSSHNSGNSSQIPSDDPMLSSDQSNSESAEFFEGEDHIFKQKFEDIHGFWLLKSQENLSSADPPATAFSLDTKEPEDTGDAMNQKDCAGEPVGEGSKDLDDGDNQGDGENDEHQDDEHNEKEQSLFEKLRQKTIRKWRIFTGDESFDETIHQPQASEDDTQIFAYSPPDEPDEANPTETDVMAEETEPDYQTEEQQKINEKNPDKPFDFDPQTKYLCSSFWESNTPEESSK